MWSHTFQFWVKTTAASTASHTTIVIGSIRPIATRTTASIRRLAVVAVSHRSYHTTITKASSIMTSPYSLPAKPEWSTPKKEGDAVPSVIFKTRVRIESDDENPFEWKDVASDDLFKGKRVVLTALPGAFTPTCSSTHLPGYDKKYDEIKSYGIDEVYCLSVNDAFVMRQWGLKLGLPEDKTIGANGFKNVKLLPDGKAHFTRGMGMSCVWEQNRGFGERSWRYSAVINDGIIEKLFMECGGIVQDSGPDPFEVTDPDTMINYLKSKQ